MGLAGWSAITQRRRAKLKTTVAIATIIALATSVATPYAATAREDNYNAGAAAAASPTGVSNANCNSALVLFCDDLYSETAVVPVSNSDSGRTWDTGKAAFPGSDTAREVTVSWQSGRTNAVFSGPAPSGGVIVLVMCGAGIAVRKLYGR